MLWLDHALARPTIKIGRVGERGLRIRTKIIGSGGHCLLNSLVGLPFENHRDHKTAQEFEQGYNIRKFTANPRMSQGNTTRKGHPQTS